MTPSESPPPPTAPAARQQSADGAEAEILGIGTLMMKPSTEKRVGDFLRR